MRLPEITKNIISQETYNKWIEENPNYSKVTYEKFRRYWSYYTKEAAEQVRDSPFGVEFPYNMGFCRVVVFDIDFKCMKDFNKIFNFGKDKSMDFATVVETEDPKRVKIMWKKHRRHERIMKWWGCDYNSNFKSIIGKGIAKDKNRYMKVRKMNSIPSKCEDLPEKSLFD